MSIFTDRLHIMLDIRQMQQKELACSCGFSAARLNNYITGRTEPSIDALVSICKALDTSSDYLLGLAETSSPQSSKGMLSEIVQRDPLDDLDDDLRAKAEGYIASLRDIQQERTSDSKQEA